MMEFDVNRAVGGDEAATEVGGTELDWWVSRESERFFGDSQAIAIEFSISIEVLDDGQGKLVACRHAKLEGLRTGFANWQLLFPVPRFQKGLGSAISGHNQDAIRL